MNVLKRKKKKLTRRHSWRSKHTYPTSIIASCTPSNPCKNRCKMKKTTLQIWKLGSSRPSTPFFNANIWCQRPRRAQILQDNTTYKNKSKSGQAWVRSCKHERPSSSLATCPATNLKKQKEEQAIFLIKKTKKNMGSPQTWAPTLGTESWHQWMWKTHVLHGQQGRTCELSLFCCKNMSSNSNSRNNVCDFFIKKTKKNGCTWARLHILVRLNSSSAVPPTIEL